MVRGVLDPVDGAGATEREGLVFGATRDRLRAMEDAERTARLGVDVAYQGSSERIDASDLETGRSLSIWNGGMKGISLTRHRAKLFEHRRPFFDNSEHDASKS